MADVGGLLDAVMKEIARLEVAVQGSLQSKKLAGALHQDIRNAAEEVVYSYPATGLALSTRRGGNYKNAGISSRENIKISADGFDLTIEAKAPLQHSYSYWTKVNAADVVIKGLRNDTGRKRDYKQPYPRNFLLTGELEAETEEQLVILLQAQGFDARD